MRPRCGLLACLPVLVALSGSALPADSALAQSSWQSAPMLTPAQMMMQEHNDRLDRLRRLSAQVGALDPRLTVTLVSPRDSRLRDYPDAMPVVQVVFQGEVFFDTDKTEVKPEAIDVLNTIAQELRSDVPDVSVFIAGHTDSRGTAEHNLDLGLRRAKSVAAQLVVLGVATAQVDVVSFGEQLPIADNITEQGMAENRRVEFYFAAQRAAIVSLLTTQLKAGCFDERTCRTSPVVHVDLRKPAKPVPLPNSPTVIAPLAPPTTNDVVFTDTRTVIDLSEDPVVINPH